MSDSGRGERDLARLLRGLEPRLDPRPHRFVTVAAEAEPGWSRRAFARVVEPEGVTLVVAEETIPGPATGAEPRWARITLSVHSALDAVGLIAAVAGRLAARGIAVNPVAGARHDHLLVPWERREEALEELRRLAREAAAP
jgi:hypothetical protein